MPDMLWLPAATVAATIGMGWLALAQETHWKRVCGQTQDSHPASPTAPASHNSLRCCALGALALLASLTCCLMADPAAMAVLVWVMLTTLAALIIALTLTWRPQSLRLLTRLFTHA